MLESGSYMQIWTSSDKYDDFARFRTAFEGNARKSLKVARAELSIPISTLRNVLPRNQKML